MNNEENINYISEESIELIALTKTAWINRKIILKTILIFFVIGSVVALRSPVVFISQTTFVPQVSDQNSNGSNRGIGSLASIAGINLNPQSSSIDNYISPLLYSRIIESDEFSLKLINEEIKLLNGDKFLIKDYMNRDSLSFNLISFIKKYTIGLFQSSNDNKLVNSQNQEDYNFISLGDYRLIKRFQAKFSIELNDEDGYINVNARDENAFVSTQLVSLVTKNLQSRIISLRTNKIKEQLDYSKKQYEQQKDKFSSLQNDVAEFKDSNKNISTALFLSELQKLESEYQLQQNILMTLANEYNNNKIKLSKDTPIFSVLDDVSVPKERSEPKRGRIVLIYILIGFITAITYIFTRQPLKEIIKKIKAD